ncbi:hypothetical protein CHS0354_035994 [Potamilus streckersoni]|uniref:RNase H type-1 domain-containing protein n=1 Tax=Potamilus streckersoni TaxID=2493646 RepID=A0AAE0SBM9_9BIVA|nr:hypothetical protein CHS0354_035994 [Potamilus streckersoni]
MEHFRTELGRGPLQAKLNLIIDPTPWRTHKPTIDFKLKQFGRISSNPWKLLTGAQTIINSDYKIHIHIYTDGLVSRETNRTAAAVVIPKIRIANRLIQRTHLTGVGPIEKPTNLLQQALPIIQELEINHLQIQFIWSPSHIQLPGNELAELDRQEMIIIPTEHSKQELNSIIKKSITDQWQRLWTNSTKGRVFTLDTTQC